MIDTVLCIDDDAVSLMLYKRILNKASFCREIRTCENGEDALNYLRAIKASGENPPDLVFLDINMPILSGWGFAEVYKKELADYFTQMKIFIVTSSVDPSDRDRMKQYPFLIDFVPKPFGLDLVEKLKSVYFNNAFSAS